MNLYCDRYSTCGALVFDQGTEELTRAKARARGWHLYTGTNLPGTRQLVAVLCKKCVDGRRRDLPAAPATIEGQPALFD